MAVPGLVAGIDPAVQTTETGVWMPGSIPGLDPGDGHDGCLPISRCAC
jgi:hypothetical protein